MRFHDRVVIVDLAAALPQVADEFLTALELGTRRLVAIEIANQANAERDVIQIIAVHMPAVDLPPPAIAHFDLAVACRCSVADDEVIGESVAHATNIAMVVIENARVTLPGPAVVHDNELPATPLHRRATDFFDYCPREVAIAFARRGPRKWPKKKCSPRRR